MARKKRRKTSAGQSADILIDYHGTVGRAPGQRSIPHQRTPLVIPVYEHGADSVTLQPGLNVTDRASFEAAVAKSGQMARLVDAGKVRELEALPTEERALMDLIDRTIDRDALDLLQQHVETQSGSEDLFDHYRGEDRGEALLQQIEDRRKTTTVVEIGSMPFKIRVPAASRHQEYQPQPSPTSAG